MILTLAVTAAAQTSTTQRIKGAATTTTKQETGTVTYVEGNTLVVKMSTGEIRTLTVPDSRTAMVDGREVTVHDLKVGTQLTATITTTTTPVTERTVSNLTGTVWHVSGVNVILTLPDGTNKMYKARPDMKFDVGGKKATVFDLRKGMRISAEKIVEEPRTDVAANTVVTGTAPKLAPVVAAAAPAEPAPVRQAAAPSPDPTPAPAQAAEPAAERETAATPAPSRLPPTGSQLPLAGLLGVLLAAAGLGLRKLHQS
ncbi:MAG: hypothetical protein ACRD7E_23185 [Bryobacteraceae bacterium]